MRRATLLSMMLIAVLLLAACGGAAAATQSKQPVATQMPGSAAAAPLSKQAPGSALNADYKDALPIAAQLILGSLKLEEGDLALTTDEAKTLLPLWQAYQSLSGNETTAAAELDAVLRQIQNAMSPEQVAAIEAMQLTAGDITETMQAPGGGFSGRPNGGSARAGNGGGFPQPPGGGFPLGGGPDGGRGGGFFGGGAGGEQLSPEARATAVAQRMAENPALAATFMTRGILNQLITSLQLKTGDVTQEELQAQQARRAAMRWVPAVSEATGIAVEKLAADMDGGKTLGEAIAAEGGDLDAAKAALSEALKAIPNSDGQAIEAQIEAILSGAPPPAPPNN